MYAIATLVMSLDDSNKYLAQAIVLGESLKPYISSTIHSICMIDEHVDLNSPLGRKLSDTFSIIKRVNYISHDKANTKRYKWMCNACTKWNILQYTDYTKILFMDADMIVVNDITSLFNLNPPAATFGTPWTDPWRKMRKQQTGKMVNIFTIDPFRQGDKPISHGEYIISRDIRRSLAMPSMNIMGSLVLIQPKQEMYNNLIEAMKDPDYPKKFKSLSGLDECAILDLYSALDNRETTWTQIGANYQAIPWYPEWSKAFSSDIVIYAWHFPNKLKIHDMYDVEEDYKKKVQALLYQE